MAYLVSDAVAWIRARFPDCTATDALTFVQEASNDILRDVKLYPTEQVDITLTANNYEYALDSTVLRIWAAALIPDSGVGSYRPLIETSIDELDAKNRVWRGVAASSPNMYYESGGMVGLFPPPATSTSAGYPIVRLYVSKMKTLSLGDSLPAQITTMDAYTYYAMYKFAVREHLQEAPTFASMAANARTDLVNLINGRLPRQKSYVGPVPFSPRNI